MVNINRDSGQSLEGKKVPKGVALVIVLAIMLSLSVIAGAILILARGHYHATGSQIKHTKAFYLAEGGIQYALWAIRTGNVTLPTPDNPTPIYLDVDNDLGTERTEEEVGKETLVEIYHIDDYQGNHPDAPLPPTGVLYYIESKVDTKDIPAK